MSFLQDVVAENHDDALPFGEMLAEAQRVGDAPLAFLIGVVDVVEAKLRAVAEKAKKLSRGVAARYDHDLGIPAEQSVSSG